MNDLYSNSTSSSSVTNRPNSSPSDSYNETGHLYENLPSPSRSDKIPGSQPDKYDLNSSLGQLLKEDTQKIVRDIKRNMTKEEILALQEQIINISNDFATNNELELLNKTFPERALAKINEIGNELSKSDKPRSPILEKAGKVLSNGMRTFTSAFKKLSGKKEIDPPLLKAACNDMKIVIDAAINMQRNIPVASVSPFFPHTRGVLSNSTQHLS